MRQIWDRSMLKDGTLMRENQHLNKHIAVIHSANSLTLLEAKISNALLYHAYPRLLIEEEHQIRISDLCKIIGYTSHNDQLIKSSLKALIAKVMEWNILDEETGEEDWTASSILASVHLSKGLCSYAYSFRLKELLYSPSVYGKINIIIQAKFKSAYGLSLYENCARYKGLQSTKWFPIMLFRQLMGVSADKYSRFRDFKKRVIEPSVNEVNLYSDLQVEPDYRKVGSRISEIRFKLSLKKFKKQRTPHQKLTSYLQQKFKMRIEEAQELVELYGTDYIRKKVETVEGYSRTRDIKNMKAYLLETLRRDASISSLIPQKYEKPINAIVQNNIDDSEIEKFITSLSEAAKKIYVDKFVHDCNLRNDVVTVELCNKHGVNHVSVKKRFIDYLGKHAMQQILDNNN